VQGESPLIGVTVLYRKGHFIGVNVMSLGDRPVQHVMAVKGKADTLADDVVAARRSGCLGA
jgi:hypothetical protein